MEDNLNNSIDNNLIQPENLDDSFCEDSEDSRKKAIISLYKAFSVMILAFALLIFVSVAWFTMNENIGTNGMGIKSQAAMFELRTSDSVGIYDDYITSKIDSGYTDDSETGLSDKIIWQLTKGNTDETLTQGNINNIYLQPGSPTAAEMREIQKIDSASYGLSPGDYGTLKFIIVPYVDSVDTTIKTSITCYKTDYYTTGENAGYQKDVFELMDEEDLEEAEAIMFTQSHIMFYYKDGQNNCHLINEEGFEELDITTNREITLYWVWPEKLRNILELDINGLDTSGARELRMYLLKNPEKFLAKYSEESSTVFDPIRIASDADESAAQSKANEIMASNTSYNPWGARYNNADQIIGDDVGYIFVETVVEALSDD